MEGDILADEIESKHICLCKSSFIFEEYWCYYEGSVNKFFLKREVKNRVQPCEAYIEGTISHLKKKNVFGPV